MTGKKEWLRFTYHQIQSSSKQGCIFAISLDHNICDDQLPTHHQIQCSSAKAWCAVVHPRPCLSADASPPAKPLHFPHLRKCSPISLVDPFSTLYCKKDTDSWIIWWPASQSRLWSSHFWKTRTVINGRIHFSHRALLSTNKSVYASLGTGNIWSKYCTRLKVWTLISLDTLNITKLKVLTHVIGVKRRVQQQGYVLLQSVVDIQRQIYWNHFYVQIFEVRICTHNSLIGCN